MNRKLIILGTPFILGIVGILSLTYWPLATIPVEERLKVGPGCKLGGCNGSVCQNQSAEPAMTICVIDNIDDCFEEEYSSCVQQSDGNCGWNKTPELAACLKKNRKIEFMNKHLPFYHK